MAKKESSLDEKKNLYRNIFEEKQAYWERQWDNEFKTSNELAALAALVRQQVKGQGPPPKRVSQFCNINQLAENKITKQPITNSTIVSVLRCDTLDAAALVMQHKINTQQTSSAAAAAVDTKDEKKQAAPASDTKTVSLPTDDDVLVMNMASEFKPGGGWRKGSGGTRRVFVFPVRRVCVSGTISQARKAWSVL